MQKVTSIAKEAAEDIFFGQVVMIWARWFVVATAAMIFLWGADTATELGAAIVLVLALMGVNFFFHGRYLVERPANPLLLVVAALLDVVVISTIVGIWDAKGLDSQYFILYYPVVFAFALVFPPRLAMLYTVLTAIAYSATCFLVDPGFAGDADLLKRLVMRLIILAAMGGLGTYYWRIQRKRRREVLEQRAGVIV